MNIDELREALFEHVVSRIMSDDLDESDLREFLSLLTEFNDLELATAYESSQMLTRDTCEYATLLEESFFYIINNYS